MNRLIRTLCQLATLGALLLLTGCAFGTRHVTLTYPAESESGLGTAKAEAAQTKPEADEDLVLVRFIDRRSQKERIGDVQNALGMKTASVVADNNVADWVTAAVRYELEQAGYRVTMVEKYRPTRTATLEGEILNLESSAYWSYKGAITLFAKLRAEDKELLAKEFTGSGSAGTNWGMTAKSYGVTLAEALEDALRKLVQDIKGSMPRP